MSSAEASVSPLTISRRLAALGLPQADDTSAVLARFVDLLLRWNRVYNLTGVRGVDEILDRHFVESFALRPLLHGTRIADVGTGAGLPGVPLAIAEPTRHFTLIESRAKRVHFLRHVVAELKLANVEVAHGRAEHLHVERPFDTVLARAVAPPAELLTICRHLTAPGSILLLLTAGHLQDAFRGLAPDFLVRPVSNEGPRLRSSIVVLERINA